MESMRYNCSCHTSTTVLPEIFHAAPTTSPATTHELCEKLFLLFYLCLQTDLFTRLRSFASNLFWQTCRSQGLPVSVSTSLCVSATVSASLALPSHRITLHLLHPPHNCLACDARSNQEIAMPMGLDKIDVYRLFIYKVRVCGGVYNELRLSNDQDSW